MTKAKITILPIERDEAIPFIWNYHYSNTMPRLIRYYLGCYIDSQLKAVITLGWGTQPLKSIQKIFPYENLLTKHYLEIGKMCFVPEMNNTQSFGSQVLTALIQWMKKNTDCLFLYTLADGIESKCGYVYQAANFYYCGFFKTSVYLEVKTSKKIHPRAVRKLLEENANFEGVSRKHWLSHEFCSHKGIEKINGRMFRYIYPLTKTAKHILKNYPQYQASNYPKNNQLLFEKRIGFRKYQPIAPPKFKK